MLLIFGNSLVLPGKGLWCRLGGPPCSSSWWSWAQRFFSVSGFRALGLWGFRVSGLGLWGFRVFWALGLWGFRALGLYGLGFRVFRVWGLGFI